MAASAERARMTGPPGLGRPCPRASRWRPGRSRCTPPTPEIPCRELAILVAYVETGSHKAAAHRLGISESTCRQRVSQLMGRVGARNDSQAVWALRAELEVELVPAGTLGR